MKYKFFYSCLLFFISSVCYSQTHEPILVSEIKNSFYLDSLVSVFHDSTLSPLFIETHLENFKPIAQTQDAESMQWHSVSYFYFQLKNNTDQNFNGAVYPGREGNMRVAQVDEHGKIIHEYKAELYESENLFRKDYFLFTLAPDSSCCIVVRAQPQLVYYGTEIWLMPESFVETFFKAYVGEFEEFDIVFYVFGGMYLMMFFYIMSQFILIRTPEYGYYAAYIIFIFGYLFIRAGDALEINAITSLGILHEYLTNQFQVAAYCMYFAFLTHFLRTKQSDVKLDRLFKTILVSLVSYSVVDAILIWKDLLFIHLWIWNAIRFALIVLVFYIAFRVSKLKHPYAWYPIIGGIIFILFALIALILSLIYDDGLYYYFIGVIMELIFFSLGLANKRRRDAIEKVEAQEALKVAEEKQRFEQYKTVVKVQESERTRIAKDLHDGVGGMLSGIKLSLTTMKGNMIMPQEQVQVFERSLDMLDHSIKELRQVSHNLMPETLVKFGLAAALKDFSDFINQSNVVRAIFQQVGDERRLDANTELLIYRVANELINNALRHAQASEIIIQLHYDDQSFTLTIEDNGKGFDKNVLDKSTGLGWPNIKSRIEYLKGTIDIDTNPDQGTAIFITIPV